jgi:hypothetical protein
MRRLVCAALVLFVTACAAPGPTDPAGDQAAAFRGYANTAKIELGRYRTAMENGGLDTCTGIHGSYDLSMRMDLQKMATLAPLLDDSIVDAQGPADVGCSTTQLADELAAHAAVACTFATLAEDQVEATRHIDTMTAALDQTLARSLELSAGLAGKGYSWTAASACP